MMTTTINIYFVRHAESTGNEEQRLCGSTDFPLSQKGYTQAELVGKYFSDIDIDVIYSSPLERAIKTSESIIKYQTVKPKLETIDALKEMNFGSLDGELHEVVKSLYPEEHLNWTTIKRYPEGLPGQESVEEASFRFINALNTLLLDNSKSNNIVITTHGTILRFFTAFLLGYEKEDFYKIPSSTNTAVTKIIYDIETKKFSIIELANSAHLFNN